MAYTKLKMENPLVNEDGVDFQMICTIAACELCTGLIITSDGNQDAERLVRELADVLCNCQLAIGMDVL